MLTVTFCMLEELWHCSVIYGFKCVAYAHCYILYVGGVVALFSYIWFFVPVCGLRPNSYLTHKIRPNVCCHLKNLLYAN